ncbi:MAG: acyl-CoA/acyl-ACP dehydrogenase [Chloroflexi bacterium]|nr:acyl-CoA/acyl-ACP dehydrogenase [Chloroflexota bacterium]MDA1271876.1 acyl-CoA/acyl-ACP dehydrogenase [Chloroflexota bacterium]
MDLGLTKEQELLRRTARDFLEAECPTSLVRQAEDSTEGHVPELWRKMAGLGWLGIALPQRYGGAGGSITSQAVLFEETGRALLPGPLLTSSALAAQVVRLAGSDAQKNSLLPGVVSGDVILTLARGDKLETASAPDSSPNQSPDQNSRGLILSGESLFVPHAGIASQIVCATRPAIGAPPDTTLVLVDPNADGVSKSRMESVANHPQYLVEFDDVPLSAAAVLGEIAEGRPALDAAVQQAAALQCAETLGRAQKVLEMTIEYAGSRFQFGRPIGTFQAIQHRCADLKVAVDAGRLLTYRAAWMLDQGMPAGEAVSMAKAHAGALSRRATETGHTVFAGISFTMEHDMQLYSARAKIAEANLGDTEYHLDQIAGDAG